VLKFILIFKVVWKLKVFFMNTIKVKNSKIQDILDVLKTFNINKSFIFTNINTEIITGIKSMCPNLRIYLHSNT